MSVSNPAHESPGTLRRGVVAVVVRRRSLLVVRRSPSVEAPGAWCFPGGGIEPGESETDALRREFLEELGVEVHPRRRIWHSVTSWGVELSWWSAAIDDGAILRPNPAEVESTAWLTVEELRSLAELLTSNRHFLDALERGELAWEFDC